MDDKVVKITAGTNTSPTMVPINTGTYTTGITDWTHIPSTTTANTYAYPWNQPYSAPPAQPKVLPTINTKMENSKFIKRNNKTLNLSQLIFNNVLGRENFTDGTIVYTVEMKIGEIEFTEKISRTKNDIYYIIPEMVEIPSSKNNKLTHLLNKYDEFAKLVNSIKINKIKSYDEDIIENIIK